jgi:hypothetical protein
MNEYLFIDEPPLLGVKRWHDVSNRELFQCRLYTVRVSFLDLRKLLIHLGLCYLEAHTKPEIFTEVLSDEGEADRFLLQEMNGTATLQQISEKAAERFPNVYPGSDEAFQRAVELARRFSR